MLHQAEMVSVLEPETKTRNKMRYPLLTHHGTDAKVIPSMSDWAQAR
jgi:hypothetical protein